MAVWREEKSEALRAFDFVENLEETETHTVNDCPRVFQCDALSSAVGSAIPSSVDQICVHLVLLHLFRKHRGVLNWMPDEEGSTEACSAIEWMISDKFFVGNAKDRRGTHENVACGSVTPSSVPAIFAVYPLMKWYIA